MSVETRTASLGVALRRARMERGASLADAAVALHVTERYLQAIESDDFTVLPPTVYTKALIREYARYLGLNPMMLQEFTLPTRSIDRNPIRPAVQPLDRGPLISWKLILSVSVVSLCALLFMYLYAQYNSFAQSVDMDRAATADALPTSPPSTRTNPALLQAFPTLTVQPTATVPPPATPVAGLVVEARLVESSWLQVYTDGRQILAETLSNGASRSFTADQSIRMRVGNAGGVDVTVNGVNQGRLGATGQALEVAWGRD